MGPNFYEFQLMTSTKASVEQGEIERLKDMGNQAFKSGILEEALVRYSEGINLCESRGSDINRSLVSQLYSNRAAVHLALKSFELVASDCSRAIAFDCSNVKAFYRASKALMSLGSYSQAMEMCAKGLAVDKNHPDLARMLQECQCKLSGDPEPSRGFTEDDAINCQNNLKQLEDQVMMLANKRRAIEIEIARNSRTRSVLEQVEESTNCFKSFGRGFLHDDRSKIITGLSEKETAAELELKEVESTLEAVGKRKTACEKEMAEIVSFFQQKSRN
jgi:chaperonin cofactor prefoldin